MEIMQYAGTHPALGDLWEFPLLWAMKRIWPGSVLDNEMKWNMQHCPHIQGIVATLVHGLNGNRWGHESMFLKIIKDIEYQANTLEIMESQMIFISKFETNKTDTNNINKDKP